MELLLVICVVVATACAAGKNDPSPNIGTAPTNTGTAPTTPAALVDGDSDLDVTARRFLVLYRDLADLCERDANNCKQLAIDLRAFGAAHKVEGDALSAKLSAVTPEQKARLKTKFLAEYQPLKDRTFRASERCSRDPEVQAAGKAVPDGM